MSSNEINLRLKIQRNINDSPQDFIFLFSLAKQLKNISNTHIVFDFAGCHFLQQNAVAFLGALIRYSQHHGNKVSFLRNSIDPSVRANLEKNGFLSKFGIPTKLGEGNSIPYREDTVLSDDSYTGYLSDKWLGRRWLNISNQLKDFIISPIIEVYINVFDHANSPIGVITCGQYYPKLRQLKLAILDFGVGIPHTVRDYMKNSNMTSKDALKWAFEPGSTTKNNGSLARGNGLKILKSFIKENNGKLEIYSDTGYVCINQWCGLKSSGNVPNLS